MSPPELLTKGRTTRLPPSFLQSCNSKRSTKISESAWQTLSQELSANGSGTLVLPSTPSYSSLALPINISYANIRPQGIAVCTSSRNVQSAIKWAAAHGISPVPRSAAGHSYAGYSTTTGLSLDMASINSLQFLGVNPTTGDELVKVGAGARLGAVSNTLAERGLILPIGRCATVGVAGLTLGGGFGFNSRKFGMTCDSLVETEIVVASGERLVCNEHENTDLFWATRGGNGGTFGVNTSFTFKTQRSIEYISVYRLRWELPIKNKEAVAKVWRALQTTATDAPNDFSLRIGLDYTPNGIIQIEGLGQYRGALAPLKEIISPALNMQPDFKYIYTLDFASAGRYLGNLGAPHSFYCKSAFTDNDFNDSAMNTAINWLEELPSTTKSGSLTFFRWGGAIEDTAPQATAFVHRKAQYVLEGTVCWRPGDEKSVIDNSRAWLQEGFDKRLTNEFNGYAFQNFIDRNLKNWETAYYGENYRRLSQVKSKHDPANLFNNAQSIRPA